MHMRIGLNNVYFPCSAAYLQPEGEYIINELKIYMYVCFKHEHHYNNPHRNFILKPDKVKPHYSQMDHKLNHKLFNVFSFPFFFLL